MANSTTEEVERMRRRLQELEMENTALRERQERQDLGRAVLTYLQNGQGGTDRVLRAVEVVQRVYAELEIRIDPQRQAATIRQVKELKGKLISAMNHRNVSGVVHLAALCAQVFLQANPVGKVAAGVLALGANSYSFYKRRDVEVIWRKIQASLEADVRRFERLVEAIEALDRAWRENFEYSIHSERFRALLNDVRDGNRVEGTNVAAAAIADDPKLRNALVWFARDVVWKNIKLVITSQYFFSIVQILSAFVDDPIVEFAVPGVFAACQIFLLVKDYYSDKNKLDEIDKGILRMQRQSAGIEELTNEE